MAKGAARDALHLLVILLAFSRVVISLYADVPTLSRTSYGSLLRNIRQGAVASDQNTHQRRIEKSMEFSWVIMSGSNYKKGRRLTVDYHDDYPGPGANNRHSPKGPPPAKL